MIFFKGKLGFCMKVKKLFVMVVAFSFLCGTGIAAVEEIPYLSKRIFDDKKQGEGFSFLAAGHLFGTHNESLYPAASLIANVDKINGTQADFFMAMGDLMHHAIEKEWQSLEYSFLNRLDMPVLNAPGNHDFTPNEVFYQKEIGETYFSFVFGPARFIVIDTEMKHPGDREKQVAWFYGEVEKFSNDFERNLLFIISHRLVWAIGNESMEAIIPYCNFPREHKEDFFKMSERLLPNLRQLKEKRIYFLSGDVGAYESMSLFYDQDPSDNIFYAACGLGDQKDDLLLEVQVSPSANVWLRPISLHGNSVQSIENYGLDFWLDHYRKNPNRKPSLIQRFKNVSRHRYFWFGVMMAVFGMTFFACVFVFYRGKYSR